MDALTAIHSRRSIRKYTSQPVSEQDIKTILDAAMIAPSAGNSQPWQFIIIDDKRILDRIPSFHPYAGMTKEAPLGILVCGDTTLEKYPGFWVQDCSAAIQNMVLASCALGLGSVWTGVYPVEERVDGFRRLCSLPETIIPLGLVVIGHPEAENTIQSRYQASRVHRNTWDN